MKYFHPEVDPVSPPLVVLGKQRRRPGTSRPGPAGGKEGRREEGGCRPPASLRGPGAPPKLGVGVRLPQVCVLDEAAHQLPGISAAAPAGRDGG